MYNWIPKHLPKIVQEILDGGNEGYDEEFDEYEFLYEADHEESISATVGSNFNLLTLVQSVSFPVLPAGDRSCYP